MKTLESTGSVRERVDARLLSFLRGEAHEWRAVDGALALPLKVLEDFVLHGGKRLRPEFAYAAFVGAGGDGADERIVQLGAAIEMLHTFALVHDDVMDGSASRRHRPTVHCALEARHRRLGWRGEPRRVSEGLAILIGDLAFAYADRLAIDLPRDVVRLFDRMRVELHMGQYLDLVSAAEGPAAWGSIGDLRAERIMLYKTAKYSVERPLVLGAVLAQSDAGNLLRLSRFGLAVGEAFQLRDDLLGAFGDPSTTGKPSGDDFREGKLTCLVAHAYRWATDRGDALALGALAELGSGTLSQESVARLQALLVESGAVDAVERRIARLIEQATIALDGAALDAGASARLAELAQRCAWRAS